MFSIADDMKCVQFHFVLFQKRVCTEVEVHSPEGSMDTSDPFSGSSQQEDQQQVMVLIQIIDITSLLEGSRTSLFMWNLWSSISLNITLTRY